MRRQSTALDLENIETIIYHRIRETIDALRRRFLEKSLKGLHQVHEGHSVESAEVAIHNGLVTVAHVESPLDIAETRPDIGASPPVMKDWGFSLVRKRLGVLRDLLGFSSKVNRPAGHRRSYSPARSR